MSETWWKLNRYYSNGKIIEPVEVVKNTPQTVLVREKDWNGKYFERRHNKEGEYFPTFAEAKHYAVQQGERRFSSAQSTLDRAREELRKMRELQEPNA